MGKTLVSAALCHQLLSQGVSVQPFKPIISGYTEDHPENTDSGILLKSMGINPVHEEVARISPWRFSAPISPDMAARKERRSINFQELVHFSLNLPVESNTPNQHVNIIEGVGGAMVPLDDRHTVMDWMANLQADVLVVAGSYLGTISHTLTTISAMNHRHIKPIGIVVSESQDSPVPVQLTTETIARFLPEIPMATIPRITPSGANWKDVPDLLKLLKL